MKQIDEILFDDSLSADEKGIALDKLESKVKHQVRLAELQLINEYRYCPKCGKPYKKTDFGLYKRGVLNKYQVNLDEDNFQTEFVEIYVLKCPEGHEIPQDRNFAGYYIHRIGGENLDAILADTSDLA